LATDPTQPDCPALAAKRGRAIHSASKREWEDTIDTLFTACEPRADVLQGTIRESDYAADLAQVIRGDAPPEYKSPANFFANTYPTKGLRNVLRLVAARVMGRPEQVGAIFRLDTQFGGGKTHTLIALAHAMGDWKGVEKPEEFLALDLRPTETVRVAAFDGENADPANGRKLGPIRARTPWGELAYALKKEAGYRLVEASDESGVAPGADTLRELIGSGPVLILLDELAPYLRKVSALRAQTAAEQLSAFLTSLFKAVESSPRAALVFTLALGRDGVARDAYSGESQAIASFLAEADSVVARKATVIDPTEDDETVKVICRRLFLRVDETKARAIVAEYKHLWDAHRDVLPPAPADDRRTDEFIAGYPLHPELIDLLTQKTATLGNFQRVRGMLRLLARTVARLWKERPDDACAVHTHHIDLGFEPIRTEIITRLNQPAFDPALRAEIATVDGQPAFAQQLDRSAYTGLPTYGSYVARTIFMHTLAFNDALRGVTPEQLRYAVLGPKTDIAFIDDARKRFVSDSAYLDDRPGVPLRFLAEANLTQIIRRQEVNTDPAEVRSELNDYLRELFKGPNLNLVPFAAGPHDVPDDDGNGRPYLVLIGFEAASITGDAVRIEPLIVKIYSHKGAGTDFRHNRNNLVFIVSDAAGIGNMRAKMLRRLALKALRNSDKVKDLADYQVAKLGELASKSDSDLALAVQQCYRHVFYPSKNRLDGANVDLAHTVIDIQTASDRPGDGQKQVVTQLQSANKLRLASDQPDSPVYVRDRTPLRKGQITTAALRAEFRLDPSLPMLVGDDVFIKGIRAGIDQGEYVYQSGDLVRGKGDPIAEIKIDEQSSVLTAAFARDHGIWPRPAPAPSPQLSETSQPPSPTPTPTAQQPATELQAEDALKAALAQVFEKAQRRGVKSLVGLTLRVFDKGDALKMFSLVNSVPNAGRRVEFQAAYETKSGAITEVKYGGSVEDALPLKDLLDTQFRGAADADGTFTFLLRFDPPLAVQADNLQRLTERLARVVNPSAHVLATPDELS
jgi:hypothetical protein